MAIYRNVQMSFWTDAKVVDEFTPEDRYFYLYLFTNPHTNLCGCYEISKSQMSIELGYSKDIIEKLLNRFSSIHNVIRVDNETKEILLLNWHKYNWTKSLDFRKALEKEIVGVKNQDFKEFLLELSNGKDTVYRPSSDGVRTTDTDTVTDTVTDNKSENAQKIVNLYHEKCPSLPKVLKVTDARKKLVNARLKDYSEEEIAKAFEMAEQSEFLVNGNGTWKGASFDWILNPNNIIKILEGNYSKSNKTEKKNQFNNFQQSNYDWDEINKELGIQ